MEGRRLDDFLEALQRYNPADLNATLPTFFEVARTLGLCLDLDSWAQLRKGLLLNKQLLAPARKDCHFALANQALTNHVQALVLQQLTVLQKGFATLRLKYSWLYLNFPLAFFLNFFTTVFGDDQDFEMQSNPRAGKVPGSFTEYNFWVTLASVVPFLFSGRQAEQVRFPGEHFGRTASPEFLTFDFCISRFYGNDSNF